MIHLSLLEQIGIDFTKTQFDEKSIIKIEKLLNAESKINPNISKNDIDNLIQFLKLEWKEYHKILSQHNIRCIISNKNNYHFNKNHSYENSYDDLAWFFNTYFSENIEEYINTKIRNNQWQILLDITKCYKFLFNEQLDYKIKDTIEQQLKALTKNIENKYKYDKKLIKNHFSTIPYFYNFLYEYDKYNFEDYVDDLKVTLVTEIVRNGNKDSFYQKIYGCTIYFDESDKNQGKLKSLFYNHLGFFSPFIKILEIVVRNETKMKNTVKIILSVLSFLLFISVLYFAYKYSIAWGIIYIILFIIITYTQINNKEESISEDSIQKNFITQLQEVAFKCFVSCIITIFLCGILYTIYLIFKHLGCFIGTLIVVLLFYFLSKYGNDKEKE